MEQGHDYDIIVIGSGPAGQRAAIQAAKLGKKVAVVERRSVVGGVSVHTGTIPSKTLREAILFLSGYDKHEIYGEGSGLDREVTIENVKRYIDFVIQHEIEVTEDHLRRNGVDILAGSARFVGPETVAVLGPGFENGGGDVQKITGRHIIVATGTKPRRDPHVPFDGIRVLDSDDIIRMDRLPRSLAVMGAGVIGCEYATMFAALGIKVTVIDKRTSLLRFIDREIVGHLMSYLRGLGVEFELGEEVGEIEAEGESAGNPGGAVKIALGNGRRLAVDKALYSIGRVATTDSLDLPAAGIEPGRDGLINVDDDFRTSVPNIFAAGDVIGFPSLASTSMEQGRRAACAALGVETASMSDNFPYGIYTIPEISYVGMNEEHLAHKGMPHAIGRAEYREIARGLIVGDTHGLLKLIFDPATRKILGLHIIGRDATDLVHLGQAVRSLGGTIDYFMDSVFNYPTLAETYKVAAFDGINRLLGRKGGK